MIKELIIVLLIAGLVACQKTPLTCYACQEPILDVDDTSNSCRENPKYMRNVGIQHNCSACATSVTRSPQSGMSTTISRYCINPKDKCQPGSYDWGAVKVATSCCYNDKCNVDEPKLIQVAGSGKMAAGIASLVCAMLSLKVIM